MITQKNIIDILAPHKELLGDKVREIAEDIVKQSRTFTKSAWLIFDLHPRTPGHTTFKWEVLSAENSLSIGVIKWSSIAKSYCFFAKPEEIVLTATQLNDIATYIHTVMDEWRNSKK